MMCGCESATQAVFVMLVGLPGSGKSEEAARMAGEGYHVYSSDTARRELYGSEEEQRDPAVVFDLLARRIRADLAAGNSCVLDATNVGGNKRAAFLRRVRVPGMTARCVVMVTPIAVCLERNAERGRDGGRLVDPAVIDRMVRGFSMPAAFEGWDEIEMRWSGDKYDFDFDALKDFKHDNPHHKATVGWHTIGAVKWCDGRYCRAVREAALYHDIGKLYTKRFADSHGNPTKIAHFYGHEGYSAYLYLCDVADKCAEVPDRWEQAKYIAALISYHMRPYSLTTSAAVKKLRDLIGDKMFSDLMDLHTADIMSEYEGETA